MGTCDNCFFFDNCSDRDKENGRCEYYYPLMDSEDIAVEEFENDLRMREEEYRKVVEEQQS